MTTRPTPVGRCLEELNDSQREAALHTGGPLLIVAGAGSGKTRTLAARVAHLIEDGANPERMLLLTFTRRSAHELLARSSSMCGPGAGRVLGGTFHSAGHRLLQRYGRAVGLRPGFTVLDQGDATDLLGSVRTDAALGERGSRFPRKEALASICSRVVNAQVPLGDVLRTSFPWCADAGPGVQGVLEGYMALKREQNLVDYDDILLYWRALARSEQGGPILRELFDHVLVDEYQDTNRLQSDILTAMFPSGSNVAVVGDDAQAIYSFRAATSINLTEFPQHYPDARIVTLEENYRSTPEILDAANAVIGASSDLYPKTLRPTRPSGDLPRLVTCTDETMQSTMLCEQILARREEGIDLRDQAVLFRTSHHSEALEFELARRNIPFVKYGGLKYLEAGHIKDMLAMLRLIENPTDQLAWRRVFGLIEGVGPATIRDLAEVLQLSDAAEAPGALDRFRTLKLPVKPRSSPQIELLRDAIERCVDHELSGEPGRQIEEARPFFAEVFPRQYENAEVRLADLDHLATLAAGSPDRATFLAELTLDPPNSTGDLAGAPLLDDDYLILSTIHSAKGGEWKAVYLIHASDGNLPSDMALGDKEGLEEERRLAYVAMTRARDHLTVSFPLRYYYRPKARDDAHTYACVSRFLEPAMDCFEQIAAGYDHGGPAPVDVTDGPDVVTAELEGLFSL